MIVYHAMLNTRFSDFDTYGHANSAVYVDFVISSRWEHQSREYGLTAAEFVKRGLGFFVSRFEIDFKRPIPSTQSRVLVNSWVTGIVGARVLVDFEIWNETKESLHAKGKLVCVSIDLAQNRPCELPDWVRPYLVA